MTKPQIWVAAFLALFILLFMIGRLTKEEEPMKKMPSFNNPVTEENTGELSAEQLINNFGCVNCHGNDLAGTQMAPALKNLSEHWGKESLLSYLRNPNAFMDDDRFKEFRKKYPGTMMPPYGEKNIKDLGKIVDYLLTH
jgi:cytochrome c2